jgi:hypothetical protein
MLPWLLTSSCIDAYLLLFVLLVRLPWLLTSSCTDVYLHLFVLLAMLPWLLTSSCIDAYLHFFVLLVRLPWLLTSSCIDTYLHLFVLLVRLLRTECCEIGVCDINILDVDNAMPCDKLPLQRENYQLPQYVDYNCFLLIFMNTSSITLCL